MAGVSQATVSRVLQGGQNVAPGTRSKVLTVLERTRYKPNAAATTMRTKRTGTIGVVVERMTNPFYPQLLEALGADLERRDLQLILWNASVGAGERSAIEAIEGKLIDGLIFTTATAESATLRMALERQAPLVLTNRVVDDLRCDQVDSDNEAASSVIAQYFADHGHTRLGLVAGPLIGSTACHRTRGFANRVNELGSQLIEQGDKAGGGSFTHEGGYRAFQTMFASGQDRPTAIFCVNDLSAFGAQDAARSKGLRVPDDVWIAGFDDIDMASWEAYDLTTARQPIAQMIKTAVNLLLKRIDNSTGPVSHYRFPNEIIVRGSTAHAALP